MRILPPVGLIFALLAGVLTAILSIIAPPGYWVGYVAPRAAAENAVAQAELVPYQMAKSEGFSALDDDGCPMPAVLGWRRLIEAPDAWVSFDWLLGYAATPAGRVLALAGLHAVDSVRFQAHRAALLRKARLPDSIAVVFGWVRDPQGPWREPLAWVSADSLWHEVERGAIGRDLGAIQPRRRGCFQAAG
jgi:hypothetical protein